VLWETESIDEEAYVNLEVKDGCAGPAEETLADDNLVAVAEGNAVTANIASFGVSSSQLPSLCDATGLRTPSGTGVRCDVCRLLRVRGLLPVC
jgi:hypothetical protein